MDGATGKNAHATEPGPLTARELMSAPARTVEADATVAQAWALMIEGGHRHLIVSSRGQCCGVLDDRTLLAHWPTDPIDVAVPLVRDLLQPQTSCVLPEASATTVASIMIAKGVDAVPVTDEAGQVVGVVTSGDLAAAVAHHGLRQ